MCNNDSYLIFQCLVNKQQNSNSADIFIQYLAKMTSVKKMDIRVKVIHNFTYTQLWWDFLSILWHFFKGTG